MMILASRNFFYWVIWILTFNAFNCIAQIPTDERIRFLNQGELSFFDSLPDSICLIQPVYENKDQLSKIQPIKYTITELRPTSSLMDGFSLGCYLITTEQLFPANSEILYYNILEEYPSVQQITVTKSSSYLGFLEELLNIPFVLPPRRFKDGKHQTDLRLAVDCAELAIYGRRRQGYNIPYCGPKRITEYMNKTDSLFPGVVIHFGHQVSVLYEDRGKIGILDSEDLLIHAYKDKVEIICLKDTDLAHQRYTLLDWK